MEKLQFTVLIENTSGQPGLVSEHGFSALLRRGEQSLLFDCGDSGAFIDNASKLGEPLDEVTTVALSHNHYDHTRGFLRFARAFPHAWRLYLSQHFFKTGYWRHEAEPGLLLPTSGPLTAARLSELGVDWRLVEADTLALPEFPGAYLLSGIPRTVAFEGIDPLDVVERGGGLMPDDYRDEQVLVCESESGLVVVSGCSHVGIVNIVEEVKRRFDNQHIAAVVGGTHLVAGDAERIDKTVAYLKNGGIDFVGVCHCTGEAGFAAAEQAGLGRINTGFRAEY